MFNRGCRLAASLLFGSCLAQDLFIPASQPAGRLVREAATDSNGYEIRRYTATGDAVEGPSGRRLHWLHTNSFVLDTKDFDPICAPNLVKDACLLLNGDPDPDVSMPDTVEPDMIRESVMATTESIEDFWEMIGLPVPAKCSALCTAVVDWLTEHGHKVPPASDVGCRNDPDSKTVECDIDLRPEAVHESGELEGGEDGTPDDPLHDPGRGGGDRLDESDEVMPPGDEDEEDEDDADDSDDEFELSMEELVFDVANMFRIYPAVETQVNVDEGALDDGEAAKEAPPALRGSSYETVRRLSNETGRRLYTASFSRAIAIAQNKAVAYIATAVREFQRRNTKRHMDKWFGPRAYSSPINRNQVKKVMLSVKAMLGNVEYVYPGPQCSPQTYAYVYPKAYQCSTYEINSRPCTKTHGGKFVFYMCPLTMKSPIGEQVETLTHEGSHHATAFTDDVCMTYADPCPQVAYGRETCASLAKRNPMKALKNADNYCYYIQDITDLRWAR